MTTESPVTVDLERLEELAKAATPGPWYLGSAGYVGQSDFPIVSPAIGAPIADFNGRPGAPEKDAADAAYIAAASPDTILALIAENRRLARLGGLDRKLLVLALERAEDGYIGYGWPDAESHAEAVMVEYEAMLTAPSADEVRGILSQCAACENERPRRWTARWRP